MEWSQPGVSDVMVLSTMLEGLRKGKDSLRLRNGHPGLKTARCWLLWQKRGDELEEGQRTYPKLMSFSRTYQPSFIHSQGQLI